LPRTDCAPVTALRFLQTSQNQFPLVKNRTNRDIAVGEILDLDEFREPLCSK
jgi:hypothetical protein